MGAIKTQVEKAIKPLGGKAYGSIGHLPNSRLGPADHSVHEGQGVICCVKARDKHDRIIVQEKLDGSCVSVALLNGEILALSRAGYLADTSPYEQHHLFADWVEANALRFRDVLREGERVCGEWLAQAHGTIYDLAGREPFGAFDIFSGGKRIPYDEFMGRVHGVLDHPELLHDGGPLSTDAAMAIHADVHWPCDEIEGVVYRVERKGEVDFLAKFVRQDKADGKYLESVTGGPNVWNWRPEAMDRSFAEAEAA